MCVQEGSDPSLSGRQLQFSVSRQQSKAQENILSIKGKDFFYQIESIIICSWEQASHVAIILRARREVCFVYSQMVQKESFHTRRNLILSITLYMSAKQSENGLRKFVEVIVFSIVSQCLVASYDKVQNHYLNRRQTGVSDIHWDLVRAPLMVYRLLMTFKR